MDSESALPNLFLISVSRILCLKENFLLKFEMDVSSTSRETTEHHVGYDVSCFTFTAGNKRVCGVSLMFAAPRPGLQSEGQSEGFRENLRPLRCGRFTSHVRNAEL